MGLRNLAALLIFSAVACALSDKAISEPTFPELSGRVVDQAQILDPSVEARISNKLEKLEGATKTQLVVVTLSTLQGYDIADFGYRLGRYWGIGEKTRNNGTLFIVAPGDRKVRIEVGYGLEGTLTDAISNLIITNAVLPRFRAGDYPGGIERGVDDLIQVLSGDTEDFRKRAAQQRDRTDSAEGTSTLTIVLILLFVWYLVVVRRPRRNYFGRSSPMWLPIPTGSRRGWSGGDWSSGSGGGGFSGGGGSFGGGGASGSW